MPVAGNTVTETRMSAPDATENSENVESSSDKLVVSVRSARQVHVPGDLEWERDAVFSMALTPLDHSSDVHRRVMRTLFTRLDGTKI